MRNAHTHVCVKGQHLQGINAYLTTSVYMPTAAALKTCTEISFNSDSNEFH